ncbi:MAG: thioredoxin [Oscillospiraceae bacterium]|jgi:thioredoxin 1|nr:thioredoxin [Oscillospiraceae bacterium]
MAIAQLEEGTFDNAIRTGAVLVDFWADWCRPCRMVAPIIEELSGEYGGKVGFAGVDVDACGDVAARYGVMSIPTVILFINGAEVKRIVGAQPKNIYQEALASL